jgi:hypothetical protein
MKIMQVRDTGLSLVPLSIRYNMYSKQKVRACTRDDTAGMFCQSSKNTLQDKSGMMLRRCACTAGIMPQPPAASK